MAKVNYTKTDKRLKILEAGEIDVIYGLPIFNEEEQEQYFSLSPSEEAIYQQFRSVVSRLYFILQLGYFKSRHQFFIFNFQDVVSDASYVQHRYLPNFSLASVEISKSTRLKQQQLILTLFNYRYCEATDRQKLRVKAQQVVKVDSQPIYIFRELMRYLAEQSLIAPGYSFMQDLIGNALKQEQARLITIATNHLSQADRLPLNKLLTNPDGLYELTRLKREPKDFSHKEISQEIKWSEQITDLYGVAQKLLFHLAISNESIKYYATLVSYYSVYQLNQLDEQLISIYLLCFIYHRYQKLHDNLIHCFIYHTRRYLEESKQVAKERVYAYRLEHNANLSKAGQVLQLFTDDTIVGTTPFKLVRDQAFAILEPLQLEKMATYIVQKTHFDETLFQWEHIEIMARRFKRRLRPLLKAIDFRASAIHEPLLAAIYFLRMTWQKENTRHQHNSGERPMHFIPNSIKRYLYVIDKEGHKLLHPDRYEFLVYRSLRNSLEAGHVFCQDSIHFRSFENDLVDDVHWQEKETLFANLALPMLNITATEQLSMLKQQLEERLQSVNQRIVTGENEYVQVKTRAHSVRWTLPYSSTHETANHPFFEILPQINIQTILHFVNQQCFFMSAFTHVLHRYTKQTHDDRVIIAGLLAWGTNMGLGRMGQISDISYQALAATSGNFIRLETLQKANDIVSNAVASLPIFKQFSIGNTLHSSSDGQKFETLLHTLNARHSPKYFGLQKGVVAYTLIANHIPINAKIIGADEHESHFVFDILHNNHTEVQPTIHSTDTHGTNEVNFAILSFFDYQFAPRYRDIYDKIRTSLPYVTIINETV